MSKHDRQSFLGATSEQDLKRAKVGVIGLGGGGSHVIQQLAHLGVANYVLVDPDTTPMAPLAERLLLARQASTLRFWDQSRWADLTLAQALTPGVLPPSAPPVVNA